MRRLAAGILILLTGAAAFAGGAGADNSRTYEIEMFNAFGIVEGSDVRVAGVNVVIKEFSKILTRVFYSGLFLAVGVYVAALFTFRIFEG